MSLPRQNTDTRADSQARTSCAQVNWQTLWMSWMERDWREVLVMPLIVGIMLVPVGIFSGEGPSSLPSIPFAAASAAPALAFNYWTDVHRLTFLGQLRVAHVLQLLLPHFFLLISAGCQDCDRP